LSVDEEAEQRHPSTAALNMAAILYGAPPTQEVVAGGRLTRVGARPPLGTYIKQLWQRRYFLVAEARAKASNGTRENLLGKAWLILSPIVDGLTYFVIFGLILDSDRRMENFLGFLLIGVFLFSFTTRCLTGGARSVAGGRNLIRAFTFPRASLPISVVLRELFNMVPVLAALFLLLVVIPPVEPWGLHTLLFLPVLALQVVFSAGLSLLFGRLCAAVPDLTQLISVAARLWMWGSGVMFPIADRVQDPTALAILTGNPMFQVLDMARTVLIDGQVPASGSWITLAAWALGTFAVGFFIFWQAEESYGRA